MREALIAVTELLRPLEAIDWLDATEIRRETGKALSFLSRERDLLGSLIRSLAMDPDRFRSCEKDNQVQLLLLRGPSDLYRVRLHIMPTGMEDYPHGHRYSFGSIVLSGTVEQTFYYPLDWGRKPLPLNPLPIGSFTIHTGQTYALSHAVVHSVRVISGPVVTLFLRGIALKAQASNRDLSTGAHRWQRSASNNDSEGRHVALSLEELHVIVEQLEALGII
jgi:hypothetical protein